MIALSTGKKVAPLPIEARLAEHPLVAQSVVVGEGRKYVGALLFLHGANGADAASIDAHVAEVNATLAPHEQVRRWAIVPHALSEAAGELTPTHKVKRPIVAARYTGILESLFT
jgi:long-chain acyl-CoA synthetase